MGVQGGAADCAVEADDAGALEARGGVELCARARDATKDHAPLP